MVDQLANQEGIWDDVSATYPWLRLGVGIVDLNIFLLDHMAFSVSF